MFDPDSISSSKLNTLRHAAELAWGDDTRNEQFVGHPQPSHGQCYVTSAWLTKHLGGHVGEKKGHFFWVSPDKHYVIDMTGDWFAYPPIHESRRTENDDPHHHTWRPGPTMYKRADHPLYKGFRIVPEVEHQRAKLFERRADAALSGRRVADLMGADPYPGETPQKQEDWDLNAPMPMLHDEPQYDPSGLYPHEYKWVFANGQLHVSPLHSHEELFTHAGMHPESQGPTAVGYVNVDKGHALWMVESNMSMRGLHDILADYSDTVGWKWDGMIGSDGSQIHEDFGAKKSMYYAFRKDGHMVMSEKPLPHGRRIRIEGKIAYVHGLLYEGLKEWAQDFGYKLAEYPGGTDMTDRMKNKENLDTFNRGDTDFQPERSNPDLDIDNAKLTCGHCGLTFDRLAELRLHERDHEPQNSEEIADGHFPQIDDFDAPLPFRRTQPSPNWGETIAMVVPSYRHIANRHPRASTYASLFGYDRDEDHRFYGAFRHGQLVGYGAVRLNGDEPEVLMIDAVEHRAGIGSAILGLIQTHYDHFYTHADSKAGEKLMRRMGMVNVRGHLWRWAKGQEPKDMIEAAIPFIYDIQGDHEHRDGKISIGYPGQRTSDIPGRFTPGGIVEGYYEPGGKVVIISATNVPYTVRQLAQLWYYQYPQMEITSIEEEMPDGKNVKLAADSVGNYLRTLVASDQAAYNAWQALRQAGGKVYIVGGAIRDALQQRQPKDLDLMVGGLPGEEVSHILGTLPGRVDLTGKRFGVYRYKVGGQEVEIALPRQDKYESSRRGEGVITVDHSLPVEKDLERRDFTANSMAVDLDNGRLIDPYGGARDIEANVLRTTHPDSFREDPTRIVRALSSHGRFGLVPDERTRAELESNGHLLRAESPDALNKVLDKLFKSGNPAAAIRLGHETGVLQHILPEVSENFDFDQNNPHHNYPLGQHLLNVLDHVSKNSRDPDLRLAALYHDVGKPASEWRDPATGSSHYYMGPNGEGANHEDVGARMVESRMSALNYPKVRINRVRDLVQHHMFPAFSTGKGARKFLSRVGPLADDLLTLREADMGGKGQTAEEMAERTQVNTMRELVDQARRQQAPTDISNLAINGNDLMQAGVPQGPQIGNILRALVEHVIETPTDNNRERLLQLVQGYSQALPN